MGNGIALVAALSNPNRNVIVIDNSKSKADKAKEFLSTLNLMNAPTTLHTSYLSRATLYTCRYTLRIYYRLITLFKACCLKKMFSRENYPKRKQGNHNYTTLNL